MSDRSILPFPHRPDDRLRLSLRRLDEALAEQRAAVTAWRREIGALSAARLCLESSFGELRGELRRLAGAAGKVRTEALHLSRTAEALAGATGR